MSARILIIENHPDCRKLMAYLLEKSGYDIQLADTGATGLELALHGDFDLILCDIRMPGTDGFEVARRLKSDPNRRRVPLVAITALTQLGDRDRVLASGFDGYVAKAVAPQLFIQQVQKFLSSEKTSPPTALRQEGDQHA